jgi:hypothetical protein
MGATAVKSIVAALLAVVLGGPAFASAGSASRTPPALTERASASTVAAGPGRVAVKADASRYAAREQSAQGLDTFKGGSYVYIGGSAIALALLIVLLVVLL